MADDQRLASGPPGILPLPNVRPPGIAPPPFVQSCGPAPSFRPPHQPLPPPISAVRPPLATPTAGASAQGPDHRPLSAPTPIGNRPVPPQAGAGMPAGVPPGFPPRVGMPQMPIALPTPPTGPATMAMPTPPTGPATIGMPTPAIGSVMPRPPTGVPGAGFPHGLPGIVPLVDKDGQTWLEHKTPEGRSYYSNVRTRETRWQRPELPSHPDMTANKPATDSSSVTSANMPPFPARVPPLGQLPFPPPFFGGLPHPLPGGMPGVPPPLGQARVWSEHKHPDGRTYYFNRLTMQSVWQRPVDFDVAMAPVLPNMMAPPPALVTQKEEKTTNGDAKEESQGEEDKEKDSDDKGTEEEMAVDESDNEEEEEEAESEEKGDNSAAAKPVATKPIPGHAPWVIVFTNDDRVFFFNQSTSSSYWETPEELNDVENLAELTKTPRQRAEEEAAKRVADREAEKRKRDAEDSKEEPPAKRPTVENERSAEVVEKLMSSTDDGLSAEEKAQRLRGSLSADERQHLFKQMLLDRQVSAFSTWDKELHKIVFDPRYLLLNVKERRQAFEQFVRSRVDEERREKKDRQKEAKADFHSLLVEVNAAVRTTSFSDFAMKHSRDKRFKAIEKMREREALYNEYLGEVRAKHKKVERDHVQKVEKDFLAMLSEDTSLHSNSRWSRVKGFFSSDSRYRAVRDSERREELFRRHTEELVEEKEQKRLQEKEHKRQQEKEKQERIAASLKERARQVQAARSVLNRDMMKERDHHLRSEAVHAFNALLADLVRDPELSWDETKTALRKDSRWETSEPLSESDKERLFGDHCDDLLSRRRAQFTKLLDEVSGLTLESTWKEIKKRIKGDPRYEKMSSSDSKRKEEFQRYMREKLSVAKADFRQLLQETRVITYKSRRLCDQSDQHMKEIVAQLKNDRRYHMLEPKKEERDDLLRIYMVDVEKRGPPPPPTASEPADRLSRRR